MGQSPSEASSHQARQEIPYLLWRPKVTFSVHNHFRDKDEICHLETLATE